MIKEKFPILKIYHKDALGNEIIIGRKYGWSKNVNGFSHVVIGEALKLSKNGVVIKVINSKRALWNGDPEPYEVKEKINTRGINLFPVI